MLNGVSITATSTGGVSNYPAPWTSCAVISTPANSVWLGPGTFTYILSFSSPINCMTFILTAAGSPGNEDFLFTTNNGIPSIIDNNSCFSTINGNTIISGSGSPSLSGGGNFTVANSSPFTTLTITGSGLLAGSLFAICNTSINAEIIFEDTISICLGDSIEINNSFEKTAGTYSDTTFSANLCDTSFINKTILNILPLPTSTISPISNQCESTDSVALIGNPSGGVFTGNGVSGTNFSPSIAGDGTHSITYTYTDTNGCVASTSAVISVIDVDDPTGTAPADLVLQCFADVPVQDVNSITDEADNCPQFQRLLLSAMF